MASILSVKLDNGKIWGIGVGGPFPGKQGSVLVPCDQIENMTTDEIGQVVISLIPSVRLLEAEETAEYHLHYKGTNYYLIYSDDELTSMLDYLEPFAGDSIRIKELIQDIENQFKKRKTKLIKRELVRTRRSKFQANREQLLLALIDRDGYECTCCKTQDNLSIDHIVPVSRGGTDDLKNLQILCRSCNSSKGAD